MDASFSRVPGAGIPYTPRSSYGGAGQAGSSMSMGSPGQLGAANSSYLPGYLLGGNTPSSQMSFSEATYGQGGKSRSPGKMKSWSPSRSGSAGHSRYTSMREKKDSDSTKQSIGGSQTPRGSRGKVPPVSDLFSDTAIPSNTGSPFRRDNQSMDVQMVGTPMSHMQSNSPSVRQLQQGSIDLKDHLLSPSRKTIPSPAQVDPFYSQGETITSDEALDECCVTIFGFPPAASSFILQQFSQYGNVLKHEVATNGNWVHIRYQSKLQAKKALSKNGKMFGNNMMIGAKQCIDKNFMFETGSGKENLPSRSSLNEVPVSSPSSNKTPIRPLTAAYQAANSDLEVTGSGSRTPQKNNNLVSKAMEYVFGW